MGAIAVLLCWPGEARSAPACVPASVSQSAAALVAPVLSERIAAHKEEFGDGGVFLGESPRSKVFEERFYKLLRRRGHAADEALAALLAFYVGEHTGEELLCEVTKRGRRMKRHLRRFLDCAPITGIEPIPPFFMAIPNFRQEALQLIASGKSACVDENE